MTRPITVTRLAIWVLVVVLPLVCVAAPTSELPGAASSVQPLSPAYAIHEDLTVSLRLCYNWSCATRETVFFTAEELAAYNNIADVTRIDVGQIIRIPPEN